MRSPEQEIHRDRKGWVVARLGRKGDGESSIPGDRVSVWKDEKALETDGGLGHTCECVYAFHFT